MTAQLAAPFLTLCSVASGNVEGTDALAGCDNEMAAWLVGEISLTLAS